MVNPGNKFVLFEGRHEVPTNNGSIFKSFNFSQFKGVYNLKNKKLIYSLIKSNKNVQVYVTGLTPALIQLIEDVLKYKKKYNAKGKLVLLHYDRNTNKYRRKGEF